MRKTYIICSEGTGSYPSAYHGECEGISFEDACCKLAATDREFAADFDHRTMTWAGCKLFDVSKSI